MKKLFGVCFPVLALAMLSVAQEELPPGKGRETIENTCAECHGLDKIPAKPRKREQWSALVEKMVGFGATLSKDEIEEVVDYLATYFGEQATPINVNTATAKELETGLQLNPAEAEAVVRHREAKGKFQSWEDVAKVEGVPREKIEAAKDRLKF